MNRDIAQKEKIHYQFLRFALFALFLLTIAFFAAVEHESLSHRVYVLIAICLLMYIVVQIELIMYLLTVIGTNKKTIPVVSSMLIRAIVLMGITVFLYALSVETLNIGDPDYIIRLLLLWLIGALPGFVAILYLEK